MLSGGADGFEFLCRIAERFAVARPVQGLAHPLGKSHVAGTRNPLNFPVFRILQNDLKALSHM